jgi:hypothetical protein
MERRSIPEFNRRCTFALPAGRTMNDEMLLATKVRNKKTRLPEPRTYTHVREIGFTRRAGPGTLNLEEPYQSEEKP